MNIISKDTINNLGTVGIKRNKVEDYQRSSIKMGLIMRLSKGIKIFLFKKK